MAKAHQQKNSKEVWGHVWNHAGFDLDKDKARLALEEKTKRWRMLERFILSKNHGFKGLKSVEIGSGIGDYSLLLAKRGVKVTLVDYSTEALRLAKKRFDAHKVKAKFIQADLLHPLPNSLGNKFDVSMSFGLVEHFEGSDRLKIVKAHKDILRGGGFTFISVPNKYSFPYQYWMNKRRKSGKWEYGLEIPFSRREILSLGKRSGLRHLSVFGSPVLDDLNTFLLSGRLKRVIPNLQISTPLDKFMGYALVLTGEK